MVRIGDSPSRPEGPKRMARVPATSAAAVPATGTSAAGPGNGVWALKAKSDQPTAARPAHPSSAAAQGGKRRPSRTARAAEPPSASSHARVGSEKKAQGWFACVKETHNQKDRTATRASTKSTGPGRAARAARR